MTTRSMSVRNPEPSSPDDEILICLPDRSRRALRSVEGLRPSSFAEVMWGRVPWATQWAAGQRGSAIERRGSARRSALAVHSAQSRDFVPLPSWKFCEEEFLGPRSGPQAGRKLCAPRAAKCFSWYVVGERFPGFFPTSYRKRSAWSPPPLRGWLGGLRYVGLRCPGAVAAGRITASRAFQSGASGVRASYGQPGGSGDRA